MITTDLLFEIDFHIFTDIKFLFNLTTRVRAKNEKARKNTVHKKSQHLNTRNLGNRQYVFPESLFIGVSLISSYKYSS